MEHKIEIKRFFLYVTVLVIFVLSFGNEAVGFTHSANAKVNGHAANVSDSLPLSSSWIQTNWPASNSFFNLCSSKNKVFARTWDSFNGGRMFLTSGNGTNWTQIGSADSSIDILSIVMLDTKILAGTWNGFIQSTDDGTTWNVFTPTGMPADTAIWSIVKMNTTLFAGTTGAIYKSTDNGITWSEIGSGIAADAHITSIVASGDNLFAGSAGNGVFKLTNNGTSWTAINSNLTDIHISQLVVLDNRLFAVTLTGVFIFDDSGTSWAADNSDLENVNCFVVVNDRLFAGTDDNGVHLSVDSSVSWTSFSSGIPADTRIWSLAKNNDGIFAGTSSGIWVTAFPTEVKEEREISVPLTFTLKQNYPNPFNPATTIQYALPVQSTVKLVIYNILGQVIKELVNAEQSAGYQLAVWNATTASGMYFYRLEAVSTVDPHQRFIQVKKMLLLR